MPSKHGRPQPELSRNRQSQYHRRQCRPRLIVLCSLIALAGAGCSELEQDATEMTVPSGLTLAETYPLDDVLRLNHIWAKGTHNSYHEQSWFPIPAWEYDHPPLREQLSDQGVRQFELDLHYNSRTGRIDVYHVQLADQRSTCRVFRWCLADIRSWSDENPGHHPIVVLLEPKGGSEEIAPDVYLTLMEDDISWTWPESRIITPDSVQGGASTLSEAITTTGWPTLGEVRGKILFVLHDTGDLRYTYTYGETGLEGRLMFVESRLGEPFAAFMIMNDPIEDLEEIQTTVEEGYLVRTRADADGQEARDNDTTRLEAALESGAHFISTDFPVPVEGYEYYVEIPGGTPSGCNPLTAPGFCYSEAIEDPDLLAGTARLWVGDDR